jgi:hypothetical protein
MRNERYEINDGIQISYPLVGCIAWIALMIVWALL